MIWFWCTCDQDKERALRKYCGVCLRIKLQVCTVTIIFAGESGPDESRVAAAAAAEASTVYNQDWFEDQHSSFCSQQAHCALLYLHRQHQHFFPANEFRLMSM